MTFRRVNSPKAPAETGVDRVLFRAQVNGCVAKTVCVVGADDGAHVVFVGQEGISAFQYLLHVFVEIMVLKVESIDISIYRTSLQIVINT